MGLLLRDASRSGERVRDLGVGARTGELSRMRLVGSCGRFHGRSSAVGLGAAGSGASAPS